MTMTTAPRFVLLESQARRPSRQKVHRTKDDEAHNTVCGQEHASFEHRYSRRTVSALRDLADCVNCETIVNTGYIDKSRTRPRHGKRARR